MLYIWYFYIVIFYLWMTLHLIGEAAAVPLSEAMTIKLSWILNVEDHWQHHQKKTLEWELTVGTNTPDVCPTGLDPLKSEVSPSELGANFFVVLHKAVMTVHGLCELSKRSSCSSRHVTGASLHGQIRAVCLCFVNRDYERAAGRQVGGGGDSGPIC